MNDLRDNPFYYYSRTEKEINAIEEEESGQTPSLDKIMDLIEDHYESLPSEKQKEVDENIRRFSIRVKRRALLDPKWNKN